MVCTASMGPKRGREQCAWKSGGWVGSRVTVCKMSGQWAGSHVTVYKRMGDGKAVM